jgi:hypothetical protein
MADFTSGFPRSRKSKNYTEYGVESLLASGVGLLKERENKEKKRLDEIKHLFQQEITTVPNTLNMNPKINSRMKNNIVLVDDKIVKEFEQKK